MTLRDADIELSAVVARDLIGRPADSIEAVGRGRNSRVYRVCAEGRTFALKRYPPRDADHHDRLSTEYEALELMQRHRIANVPRALAIDRERNFVLMSWLEGSAVTEIRAPDIAAAAAFLAAVHAVRLSSAAEFSRPAAEACLSGGEVVAQIQRRLELLAVQAEHDRALRAFLEGEFAAALHAIAAQARIAMRNAGIDFAADLPRDQQTLVPSDFGFHNAIRRSDGTLAFVDFEYFGWDDPVKLTSDVLHHPGVPLAERQRARFRDAAVHLYGGAGPFADRLQALYPLFGLRWVPILLNEFLPERWRRRVAAGETAGWAEVKARQLSKAGRLLARVVQESRGVVHA
jgi:phosphotransferase family enzyme